MLGKQRVTWFGMLTNNMKLHTMLGSKDQKEENRKSR
jgi:hypothetical protein